MHDISTIIIRIFTDILHFFGNKDKDHSLKNSYFLDSSNILKDGTVFYSDIRPSAYAFYSGNTH